jgi:TRAP-type transport system periplasmic protein
MGYRLALPALAAAAFLAAPPAVAQQINFSTYVPANEQAVTQGFRPLFDKVAQETGGAFSAQILTAGQMFGPLDTLHGI